MKFLKWLLGTVIVLVMIIGVGVAALVYLVDWNDFKDTIQNQVKKQTGRDLTITGDLSPSVFPMGRNIHRRDLAGQCIRLRRHIVCQH